MSQNAAYELANEIGPLIAQSRRIIWLEAAKRFQDAGESILTWQVLNQCFRFGPRSQRALCDALAQQPAGMCRLLDDMEQRKLVKRTRDDQDRRCMNVAITRSGEAFYAKYQPLLNEVVESAIDQLSTSERRTLRDLLHKIVTAADGGSVYAKSLTRKPRSRAIKQ